MPTAYNCIEHLHIQSAEARHNNDGTNRDEPEKRSRYATAKWKRNTLLAFLVRKALKYQNSAYK